MPPLLCFSPPRSVSSPASRLRLYYKITLIVAATHGYHCAVNIGCRYAWLDAIDYADTSHKMAVTLTTATPDYALPLITALRYGQRHAVDAMFTSLIATLIYGYINTPLHMFSATLILRHGHILRLAITLHTSCHTPPRRAIDA